ncbi:MAG: MerC domain-containing protein [Sphingobium sp.]
MTENLRQALNSGRLDRAAIALSGLCAVHCFGTAVLLGLLASAGGIFENPLFHEVGLVLAIALGALALGHGAFTHGSLRPLLTGGIGLSFMAFALTMDHGWQESAVTLVGVAILALGHVLNRRAGRLRAA